MDTIDKNYLRLQFWNKVYQKNATEFQGFFEDIMQKAFSDFKKIRPYGNEGDGGNDGYRPSEGIYYQVYAPKIPNEKEAEAARKLKKDFEHLKTDWDQISKINLFYFVFNDKGAGVSIKLEKALAELKVNNENIEFKILLPKDLETTFLKLKKDEILALGFDVDSTKALRITSEFLDKLEVDLDRGNGKFVLKALENIKQSIMGLQDEGLELSYEVMEAKTLRSLERTKDAKKKYEHLCIRYPKNPRAFLHLAEIYLNNEDFERNDEFLKKAGSIDNCHWLLAYEELLREYILGNQIDVSKIDEQAIPGNPRIKSNFYRLYSLFFERSGDQTKAESFIERAIHFNPDKFACYDNKLSILTSRIFSQNADIVKLQKGMEGLLSEIEDIEQKVSDWGGLGLRSQALINFRKLCVFRIQENIPKFEKLSKESFDLLVQCYFDQLIDKLLVELLICIELPTQDFEILLQYLREAEKVISDDLAKAIVFQFIARKSLFTEGKSFFEATKKVGILSFIDNLENNKYDKVWNFLKDDSKFAIGMANMAKEYPDLRKIIIENLPNDGSIEKDKLSLLLNYDEKNFNEAFKLLKGSDLSYLSYFECRPFLEIAQEKKAWDFVVEIIEKLLQYNNDERDTLQLNLELFTANLNLERFPTVIEIGERILSNSEEMRLLDDQNKEGLLAQTIVVRMKRGDFPEAKALIEKYPQYSKTFEFKVGVEANVYLKNKDAYKALKSIVAGVKVQKSPSPEQYGSLFMLLVEIENLIGFSLTSMKKVCINSFVKFKDQERWYFVGDDNELDATKIISTDGKYSKLLDKKVGDNILFDDKYSSVETEYTIENILPIDKYIFWQCRHHAEKLSSEHRWDKFKRIEVPMAGEKIDTKYLVAFLKDEKGKRDDSFDLYCQGNLPFAFLAAIEGSLTSAIGCITNENKGFINFSSGNTDEISQQKDVARRIISGESFYIDGTSALFLSETGLLEKIYGYLPNLKVPQSVITLLLEIKEKFRYYPGQTGHMAYAQGQLIFSSVDQEKRATILSKIENCISLLESKLDNISVISSANKSDSFFEQKILPELCDACVLAQKNNGIVLTEDFMYLKVNEFDTKKKAPEYCSTFALISVLYEQKKIDFEQYLDFFSYLSSYRFRFLPLSTEDIEKAVFGDGTIKRVQPENIRKLNFPLTLSEDYGVTFKSAFSVVGLFLVKVLVDNTILPDMAERIFVEILSAFPTDKDKNTLGKMFLRQCVQTINKTHNWIIVGHRVQEKVDILMRATDIYGSTNKLWTP